MIDFYTLDVFLVFLALVFALQVYVVGKTSNGRYGGLTLFIFSFLGLAVQALMNILFLEAFASPLFRASYVAVVAFLFLLYYLGWRSFFGDTPDRGRLRRAFLLFLLLPAIALTRDTFVSIILLNLINTGAILVLFLYLCRQLREGHPYGSRAVAVLHGFALTTALVLFLSDIQTSIEEPFANFLVYVEALNVPLQFSLFIVSITLSVMTQRRFLDHRLLKEKEELAQALKSLALSDPLTGISNRRGFESTLQYEFEQFKRGGEAYSVIIGDIDFFKRVNDSWGHDCGDLVIKGVARILRESIRAQDSVARWGGEEFILLLKNGASGENGMVVERIRTAVEKGVLDYGGDEIRITMSFGLAAVRRVDQDSDAAVIRADRMLYKAKKTGRNKVVLCDDTQSGG